MKKYILLLFMFFIILGRLFFLNVYKKDYYKELLNIKTNNYIYGESGPRGRILDRNGVVLVDNIGIKTLYYKKENNVTLKEELEIAEYLANILDIEIDEDSLKDYYLIINNNGDDLITLEEYELLSLRKLTYEDIKRLKYERIKQEDIDSLTMYDRKVSTIYNLMNKGYSYDKKIIKKNLENKEYSQIVESNISSLDTSLTWERVYPYKDILKDVFGVIGSIPEEKKDEYLDKGYLLNDVVGLSYLEYEYEDYLKGTKDIYKVNSDNTLTLVSEGKKGSDLVLSIDIEVQIALENSVKNNMLLAKNMVNTDYFSETYAIVGNPLTGEIIAMSGQKIIDLPTKTFKNINTFLINTSYTVGSVVKMGTISTGYNYKVIDIGTSMRDGCIKLYQVPLKCSWDDLGIVDDMTSISKSSNYYQFKIALGLTNIPYTYNMKLDTDITHFEKFRNMFKEYGLGSITGIDLPNESIGIIGKSTKSDLLLNLSIGQYDTYTPIELFQYVNTIASYGEKRKPQLMKSIINDNILYNDYEIVSRVPLDNKYFNRLIMGMNLGTKSGTSINYINSKYNPAGKTGTSETFIDTNNDGIMDTKTTSIAFLGFAPYDNPKYSVVVLAPNIFLDKDYEYSKLYITRNISLDITNFLFENE